MIGFWEMGPVDPMTHFWLKKVRQKLFPNLAGLLYYAAAKFPKENTRKGNQEWRGNNLPYSNGDSLMPNNNSLYVVLVNTELRATDWSLTDGLKINK